MSKRALAALVAVLAIAGVFAGCGGGGGSSSSGGTEASGPAPTKAVFIKEADAICKAKDTELNEEVESYAKENGIDLNKEPSKEVQVELYAAVVLPNIGAQAEEIGALTPPEGDEETIEELVDSLNTGVEEAEAEPELLVEGKNPIEDASKKAHAYGMKECGSE